IEGKGVEIVRIAAAVIRRIAQYRVDDEWKPAVGLGDAEPDLAGAPDHVAAINGLPRAVGQLLVDDRRVLNQLTSGCGDDQIALRVDPQVVDSVERQPDPAVVGTGIDDEVVFELLLVSVVDYADAGIDVAVFDPRIPSNIGLPMARIVSDQMVRASR